MNAPAVTDHPGFVHRLDAAKLQRGIRHYNPSIAKVDLKLFGRKNAAPYTLCAYRVQGADGVSRIGIAQLSVECKVLSDFAITFPGVGPASHVEDPRLLVCQGKLFLFVAQVDYGASYFFRTRAFILDPATLQPSEEIPLAFGRNGQGVTEKNWMPFEHRELGLCFVHSIGSTFTVYEHATGRKHESPGMPRWRWGTISGRTPAIQISESMYLAFIGGHMPHSTRRRLYWLGAAIFDVAAPFTLRAVSREPILWGSDQNPALVNPYDLNWNPLCVFPAGLIRDSNDTVLLSLGTNDSFCDILRLRLDDITAGLVVPGDLTGEERLLAGSVPADALNCEQVRVRVKPKPNGRPRSIDELGGPYATGEEFITTRARAIALGNQVEIVS